MKIFISGPITGKPDYNRYAFDRAEWLLSNAGHSVLCPRKLQPLHNPEAISHEDYMKICFVMIAVCDAVYFLSGWSASLGARMEYEYACEQQKLLMFQEGYFLELEYVSTPGTHEVINREQHS